MLRLIITGIFGLIIAFFATQNTNIVSVKFLQYSLSSIPLYFVVIGSLVVGIFLTWILSLVGSISSLLTLRGKESKLKEAQRENTDLVKQIHKLELENERLKAESGISNADDKSL